MWTVGTGGAREEAGGQGEGHRGLPGGSEGWRRGPRRDSIRPTSDEGSGVLVSPALLVECASLCGVIVSPGLI